jgi:hypothetical protein
LCTAAAHELNWKTQYAFVLVVRAVVRKTTIVCQNTRLDAFALGAAKRYAERGVLLNNHACSDVGKPAHCKMPYDYYGRQYYGSSNAYFFEFVFMHPLYTLAVFSVVIGLLSLSVSVMMGVSMIGIGLLGLVLLIVWDVWLADTFYTRSAVTQKVTETPSIAAAAPPGQHESTPTSEFSTE